MDDAYNKYHKKLDKAVTQMRDIKLQNKHNVILSEKADTHVFREKMKGHALNLRHFNRIIHVDLQNGWIDVEGMTTYHSLVNYLLPLNFMPKIIPELRSITVGGAISGVGIEATSFKYGLVHTTIQEMDVLTSSGNVITCRKDGESSDLFYGIPNSYGVLGYILRARVEIIPIKPYVKIIHQKYTNADLAFQSLKEQSEDQHNDFVEGLAFQHSDIRILTAQFADSIPVNYKLKDFRIKKVFYKTIQYEFNETEYMSIEDYIWRWDPDAYWATDSTILQNNWFRLLFGKIVLRSDHLLKIEKNTLFKFIQKHFKLIKENKHNLTQDIGIPLKNWLAYFEWYCNHINKFPLWLCPAKVSSLPLFRANENDLYCDFGTFSASYPDHATFYHTLQDVENKMLEFNGVKCFYSENVLSNDSFYKIVKQDEYLKLKNKYDPLKIFPDLIDKIIKVQVT